MSKNVSNNLYNIDFIMKNFFMEWAIKQESCHIYKHVIFKITTTTDMQTLLRLQRPSRRH